MDDCTILKLDYSKLQKYREENDDLDLEIYDCEKYIIENGLPYCDYNLDNKTLKVSPLERFREGIKRAQRIVKSQKALGITELIKNIHAQIKKERMMEKGFKRSKTLKGSQKDKKIDTQKTLLNIQDQLQELVQTVQVISTHSN